MGHVYSSRWLENWNGQNNDIPNAGKLDEVSVSSPDKEIGSGRAGGD